MEVISKVLPLALWLSALNCCIDDEGNESETKRIAGATDPRNAVTCIRSLSARDWARQEIVVCGQIAVWKCGREQEIGGAGSIRVHHFLLVGKRGSGSTTIR